MGPNQSKEELIENYIVEFIESITGSRDEAIRYCAFRDFAQIATNDKEALTMNGAKLFVSAYPLITFPLGIGYDYDFFECLNPAIEVYEEGNENEKLRAAEVIGKLCDYFETNGYRFIDFCAIDWFERAISFPNASWYSYFKLAECLTEKNSDADKRRILDLYCKAYEKCDDDYFRYEIDERICDLLDEMEENDNK